MKSGAEAERVKAQGGAGRNVAGQGRVGETIQPETLGQGRTRLIYVSLDRSLNKILDSVAESLAISKPEFIRLAILDKVKSLKAMVGESSQPETTGNRRTRRINVRLGRALKGNIIRAAKSRGISGAELLRRAILSELGSLEAKKESSQPETLGKGRTRIINVWVPKTLMERIDYAAKSLGISCSELVQLAVHEKLGRQEAKHAKLGCAQ